MIITMRAKKGVALTIAVPIYDAEWGEVVTGAAGLDSEISKDGGAAADCTNELAEIGSWGVYTLTLTATEMGADLVVIKATTTTDGAKIPMIIITSDAVDEANTEIAAVPGATASLREMIQFLFSMKRSLGTMNKSTGVETLYKDDDSTPVGTATHTDDGTTVTRGKMA